MSGRGVLPPSPELFNASETGRLASTTQCSKPTECNYYNTITAIKLTWAVSKHFVETLLCHSGFPFTQVGISPRLYSAMHSKSLYRPGTAKTPQGDCSLTCQPLAVRRRSTHPADPSKSVLSIRLSCELTPEPSHSPDTRHLGAKLLAPMWQLCGRT